MKIATLLVLSATALLSALAAADSAADTTVDSSSTSSPPNPQADDTQRQQALLQQVKELATHGVFVETFEDEELFDGKRWFKSTHEKYAGQDVSVDEYTVRTGHVAPDKGLVLDAPAKHYGLAAQLAEPLFIDGSDGHKEIVVQYEVKLQKGLTCGGAYIKLLRASAASDYPQFSDATPFVLMFGPDKCGASDKVHLIFQHRNPVTGAYEEKHLESPPPTKSSDRLAHIYTAVLRDDNTYEVFIDQQSVAKGSLYDDFSPAVQPEKEIDDPNDSKPADWVDAPTMRDPHAVKPADWDDDAPARIPDTDAVKPAGWLDNEPALIDDPTVTKPTDWDDDDDGEYVAPQVPNPKCVDAVGCGVWQRPTKANPLYKGKWVAPLVPNPAYKGEWTPRTIANPAYFEDAHPARLDPIGALAVEVWTMSDGITFDNFWLGHDLAKAQAFAAATWVPKHALETEELEKQREAERRELAERRASDGGLLATLETLSSDVAAIATANPLAAIGGAVVTVALLLVSMLYICCGKSDELPMDHDAASDKDSSADDDNNDASAEAEEVDAAAALDADAVVDASDDEPKVRQRKKKAPKAN